MRTAFFFLVYWITLPIRICALAFLRVFAAFQDTQSTRHIEKPNIFKAPEKPKIMVPPNPKGPGEVAVAGFPDHCCSRTGELVDCGILPKSALLRFIKSNGEITRAPDGVIAGPPVSGDMACGWLLGFTSGNDKIDFATSEHTPSRALNLFANWLIENKEGPTERFDCGFRRNPLLVGAQAVLPLATYWTAWKWTNDRKYFWRYVWLFWGMAYGALCLIPTAFVHKFPAWVQWIAGKFKAELPHNPRSLYNDANVMRCLAVLMRQTSGLHWVFYRLCALIVWTGSHKWHLPFMDFWALGHVRPSTLWATMALNDPSQKATDEAPITRPKWGESWDDERYFCGVGNPDSIGPYFDFYYCSMTFKDLRAFL